MILATPEIYVLAKLGGMSTVISLLRMLFAQIVYFRHTKFSNTYFLPCNFFKILKFI